MLMFNVFMINFPKVLDIFDVCATRLLRSAAVHKFKGSHIAALCSRKGVPQFESFYTVPGKIGKRSNYFISENRMAHEAAHWTVDRRERCY